MKTILMLLLVFAASVHAAEKPRIGAATKVVPDAHASGRVLSLQGEVFSHDAVKTGQKGEAGIRFIDDTNLAVGPSSEVLLDRFVYDPDKNVGIVALRVTKGAFRFSTGKQKNGNYQIKTPYGTLGVRGTTIELVVAPEVRGKSKPQCATKVRLVEGNEVTLQMRRPIVLSRVGDVACITPSGRVEYSTSQQSILPFVP